MWSVTVFSPHSAFGGDGIAAYPRSADRKAQKITCQKPHWTCGWTTRFRVGLCLTPWSSPFATHWQVWCLKRISLQSAMFYKSFQLPGQTRARKLSYLTRRYKKLNPCNQHYLMNSNSLLHRMKTQGWKGQVPLRKDVLSRKTAVGKKETSQVHQQDKQGTIRASLSHTLP